MKCAKCGKVPNKLITGFLVSGEKKVTVRICPRCKGPVFVRGKE